MIILVGHKFQTTSPGSSSGTRSDPDVITCALGLLHESADSVSLPDSGMILEIMRTP